MIVRKDQLRASKAMRHRVENTANIEILYHSQTKEILGDQLVDGAIISNTETHTDRKLDVQGFFVAIGHTPNTDIFKPFIDLDEQGYIKTIPGTTRTNVAGVFASGDAQDKVYRQAVTAAGTGCMAALDAERFLAEQPAVLV